MIFEIFLCPVDGWVAWVQNRDGQPVAALPATHATRAEAWCYCAEYVLSQGHHQITGRFPMFYEPP